MLGDSVLRGDHRYGFDGRNMPYYLGHSINKEDLAGKVEVLNYATGARTITEGGQNQFMQDPNYQNVRTSKPDALVIMFGSNDCYAATWKGADHFIQSYVKFFEEMQLIVGDDKSKIFLLTPPPLYPRSLRMDYDRGEGACDENMRNE